MFRSIRRLILPCVAALAAGAVTLACNAESATNPAASAPRLDRDEGDSPGQIVACTKREHQIGSAVIGPRGGTLLVGSNMLIVPPGALTRHTLITGVVPEGNAAAIHFEPSGLQFRKPVALFLNASGCEFPEDMPDVVYFDDHGTILERIEAVYIKSWKGVFAPITHFSGYAIAV